MNDSQWPLQRIPGKISDFYDGQVIFLTGATGFLGKILLEKLLRDMPGIHKIFCMIRPRKDVSPQDRIQKEIFASPLFDPLKERLGDRFDEYVQRKVVPVKGDIVEEDLGLPAEEKEMITREATIFIHCAATISFTEAIQDAINQNVLGSLRVLNLAKACPKLQIFTHISTAYVGSTHTGYIQERLYPLDFEPEAKIDQILRLAPIEAKNQTKKLIGKHPNTYTYTKNIAEHMLRNKRGNMPMVFCRPSIICAVAKDPIPGWIDTLAAAGGLYAACGFGLLKFLPGHAENATDQVPADFVCNNIIAATAFNARKNKLAIYHIGTSHHNPLKWSYIQKCLMPYWLMNPPKRTLGKPTFEFITALNIILKLIARGSFGKLLYEIMSGPYPMFEVHYFLRWALPVLLYGTFARTLGDGKQRKQARLLAKLEKKLNKFTQTFRHFTENQWVFSVNNSEELIRWMNKQELEDFNFDARKLDWTDYLLQYCYGLRTFALKEKGLKPPKRGDYFRRCDGLTLEGSPFSDIAFAWKGDIILNSKNINRTPEELKFMVLTSARVQLAIQREAHRTHKSVDYVETRAKKILDIMGAEMTPSILRSLAWVFRKIYRKLYSGVVINEIGLEDAKEIFAKRNSAMVLLPSHRSYIDFLIMSYVLYSFALPVPHIAAGDDFLNVMLVRWIFRRSGAFFMRRSFGDDELYKNIFAEYTQRLLVDGYPVEFFIEGTRSRSGRTLQPKMGLLSIVTDPFFDAITNNPMAVPGERRRRRVKGGNNNNVLLGDIDLIPIAISYEKVVEEHAHVKELMGEGKKKPTLSALLAAARWVLSLDFGRINVQFGGSISVKKFAANMMSENMSAVQLAQRMREQMAFTFSPQQQPQQQHVQQAQHSALVERFSVVGDGRQQLPGWAGDEASMREYVANMHLIHEPLLLPHHNNNNNNNNNSNNNNNNHNTNNNNNNNTGLSPFNPFTSQSDRKFLIDRLAYHVCRDLNSNAVCMSTAIVSTVLLTHGRYGILKEELIDKYVWLSEKITERGGWIDPILHPTSYVVARAVKLLGNLVTEKGQRLQPSIPTMDDQINWLHLGYYSGQVLHLFRHEAIIACALAKCGSQEEKSSGREKEKEKGKEKERGLLRHLNEGIEMDELMRNVQFLDDMLKHEFIPADHNVYHEKLSQLVDEKVLKITTDEHAGGGRQYVSILPSGEKYWSFLCQALWPLIDSYWLAALSLLSMVPDRTVVESTLVLRAQWLADQLFKEGKLQHFESKSSENIRNALIKFREWRIIDKVGVNLGMGSSLVSSPTVQLLPLFREERNVEILVDRLQEYRRKPLNKRAIGKRKAMIADFPMVARM